jgi:Holliday junction resolvase
VADKPTMSLPAAFSRNRTNYRRGAAFEREVAARLAEDGYRVLRAAGSHGKADLVALKPRQVVLVQCKLTGPGGVGPAEWNALWELASYVDALAVIAHKPLRGHIAYLRLIGPKQRPTRRPPAQPWMPDQLIEETAP